MQIAALDHLVLTVADIARTREFYRSVLGMETVTFGDGRQALRYGQQKINLHQAGLSFAPHARFPTPGSADLCFLLVGSIDATVSHLQASGVPIVAGPVRRTGATGTLRSIYIRDPDGNLLELSVPAGPSNEGG
ncbi:VOC family protein [Nodosilinea sp. PGN35]|uniref:VOC family protein n=1 Tax=Nodosilinea sp. PGN35 TaxID=3020489 RepID=UPI0032426188